MISSGWGICPIFFISCPLLFVLASGFFLHLGQISQEIFTAALFSHRCVMIFLLSLVNSGGLIASVLLTGFGRRAAF